MEKKGATAAGSVMKKRAATQEEKRELTTLTLNDYLQGNHGLSMKLDKFIVVSITPEHKSLLIDRSMKLSTPAGVMQFWNSLVTNQSSDTALQSERELFAHCNEVQMECRHFLPPTTAQGGWKCRKENNVRYKAWRDFCALYEVYVMMGSANGENLRIAVEKTLPIDVVFTTVRSETQAEPVMLRFHILEPLPEHQIGCVVYTQSAK
jgi:hypothetical protein